MVQQRFDILKNPVELARIQKLQRDLKEMQEVVAPTPSEREHMTPPSNKSVTSLNVKRAEGEYPGWTHG